ALCAVAVGVTGSTEFGAAPRGRLAHLATLARNPAGGELHRRLQHCLAAAAGWIADIGLRTRLSNHAAWRENGVITVSSTARLTPAAAFRREIAPAGDNRANLGDVAAGAQRTAAAARIRSTAHVAATVVVTWGEARVAGVAKRYHVCAHGIDHVDACQQKIAKTSTRLWTGIRRISTRSRVAINGDTDHGIPRVCAV